MPLLALCTPQAVVPKDQPPPLSPPICVSFETRTRLPMSPSGLPFASVTVEKTKMACTVWLQVRLFDARP